MSQYDQKYFTKLFSGLTPTAISLIAVRAAMRVLPTLATRERKRDKAFAYWEEGVRGEHALVVFRCYEISFFFNQFIGSALFKGGATSERNNAILAIFDAAVDASKDANKVITVGAVSNIATTADFANAVAGAASIAAAATAAMATAAITNDKAAVQPPRPVIPVAMVVQTARQATLLASAAVEDIVAAISGDVDLLKMKGSNKAKKLEMLLSQPLWLEAMPSRLKALWGQLQSDLLALDTGFEIWIDWYRDRLEGKPVDWLMELHWALLSKEQLAQSPAEINAYLEGLARWLANQAAQARAGDLHRPWRGGQDLAY